MRCGIVYYHSVCIKRQSDSVFFVFPQKICNGKGTCVCGVCQCEKEPNSETPAYYGPTCENCPTCPGLCYTLKACAQCQAFGTGELNDDDDASLCARNCTLFNATHVDELYGKQNICVSVCRSVCLPVWLSFCWSVCLSYFLSDCLFVFMSSRMSVCLLVSESVCLGGCFYAGLSVSLPVCLPVYLSVCMAVSLSVLLAFCLCDCWSVFLSFHLSVFLPVCFYLLSFFLQRISQARRFASSVTKRISVHSSSLTTTILKPESCMLKSRKRKVWVRSGLFPGLANDYVGEIFLNSVAPSQSVRRPSMRWH